MTEGENSLRDLDAQRAQRKFQEALQLSEGNGFLHRVARIRLADALRQQARYQNAVELYKQDVASREESDPASIHALYGLAECYRNLGESAAAERNYRAALTVFDQSGLSNLTAPDEASVFTGLMRLYVQLGNIEKLTQARNQLESFMSQLAPRKSIRRCMLLGLELPKVAQQADQLGHKDCAALVRSTIDGLYAIAEKRKTARSQRVATTATKKGASDDIAKRQNVDPELLMLKCRSLEVYRQADPKRFVREITATIERIKNTPGCGEGSPILAVALRDLALCEFEHHMPEALQSLPVAYKACSYPGVDLGYHRLLILIDLIREVGKRNDPSKTERCLEELQRIPAGTLPADRWNQLAETTKDGDETEVERRIALVCYSKAIEIDPQSWRNYQARANSYMILNDLKHAESDNNCALSHGGGESPEVLYCRAQIQRELRHFDAAIAAAQHAKRLKDSAATRQVLAIALSEQGKYKEAADEFTQAIRLDPAREEFYIFRGNCMNLLHDYKSAIADATRAISLKPASPLGYTTRARYYASQGDSKQAMADLTRAIKLAPSDSSTLIARGLALWQLHEYQSGLNDLKEAERLGSKDPTCFAGMANCYAGLKQYTDAVAAYKKAIAVDPNSFNAYWGLSAVYDELKQYDLGLSTAEKAISLVPNDCGPRFTHAKICKDMGNMKQAKEDCAQILKLGGNTESLRKQCMNLLGTSEI